MYTIFGASGFIGNEIIASLKKRKHKIFIPNKKKIKFSKNLGKIIYCVGSDDWKKKPIKGFFSNLGHLQKIIHNNTFETLIFLSTTRLYINSKNSTSEICNISANSENDDDYYNILKMASESLLLNFNRKIKILRLSNVFGYNYKSPLILPTLIKNAIKKSEIELSININSTKDYILIDDVIKLIFKILKKSKFRVYNVASAKNISLKKISGIIKKVTNCRIKLKNQKIKIMEPIININRIKKEYNFKSNLKIEKDLPKLIIKYKKNIKNF